MFSCILTTSSCNISCSHFDFAPFGLIAYNILRGVIECADSGFVFFIVLEQDLAFDCSSSSSLLFYYFH